MKVKMMFLAVTLCLSAAAHADMDFAIGMATGIPNGTVSGMVGAMLHDANEHAAMDEDSTQPIINNPPPPPTQVAVEQKTTASANDTPEVSHDWTMQMLEAGVIFLSAMLMSVCRKRLKKRKK